MDVIMPKLGMTMTSGTVVQWHKQSGDMVMAGEPLCEVETDKLNSEIEAEATGILTILAQEGDELGVGAALGQIAVAEGSEQQASPKQRESTGGSQEKIAANGITLAVQRTGSGYPLILIHGLASSMGLWAGLDQSQLEGLQIISYDLRGHGASERPTGAHTLSKHVADLKGLLAALAIKRALFAGLSLGGMIAMELAASTPDMVTGLALLDTTANFPQATRDLFFELASSASFNGMGAITDSFLQLSFSPEFMEANPKMITTIRKGMLASDAGSIAAAMRMVAKIDLSQRLSAISCPTTVLVGAQDQLAPPALSEELVAGIAGAKLQVIPDSGHVTPVEQPLTVTTALAELAKAREA
ncbi:MAG: alpha/beta fold hydrolase [Chloroflexota bacterium]|nr:alpha/beta fold hydrolase [Chloroflexota bacterium]